METSYKKREETKERRKKKEETHKKFPGPHRKTSRNSPPKNPREKNKNEASQKGTRNR